MRLEKSLHFFNVMTTLPDVLHFWNSRVSSVRNWTMERKGKKSIGVPANDPYCLGDARFNMAIKAIIKYVSKINFGCGRVSYSLPHTEKYFQFQPTLNNPGKY